MSRIEIRPPIPDMAHASQTARNHGLDTLRALAIALVFTDHYMLFVSGEPTFGIVSEMGWCGVDLFFALSGYLIGNQICAALRDGRDFSLRHFYARRLLRTLPNFYVVLALYALWPYFRGTLVLPPLWRFLSFTQNFHLMPGSAFSHAWSLCVEEQFYLLLPALALLIAARRRSLAWAWIAIVCGWAGGALVRGYIWTHHVGPLEQGGYHYYSLIYYSSLCRCDELLAGVALALLKNFHAPLWTRLTARGNWTLAAGLACSALTWYCFLRDHYGYGMTVGGYPMLALSFALLLLAALSPGSLLQRTRVPGASHLALWSYAIYLSHKQVCILINAQLKAHGWSASALPSVLLMSAASLLAGWLLYRLVETPFMRLRARYVPSNDASASSALVAV